MLPRLIRYIEERRANERRFTGAIETDPSPLHIVWGLDDPIAVPSMVDTLLRRPARRHGRSASTASATTPMVEAPQRFLDAALAGLVSRPRPRGPGAAASGTAGPAPVAGGQRIEERLAGQQDGAVEPRARCSWASP